MAKTLSSQSIETTQTVEAWHVTQSIDAFTGTEAYNLSLSGSLHITGSIYGQPGIINQLTASYAEFAVSASHEITHELSSSHAISADTASLANTASIANAVAATNIIQPFTNITSSGDISSSGTVIAKSGSFSHLVGNSPITIASPTTFLQPVTASFTVSASNGLFISSSLQATASQILVYDTSSGKISFSDFPIQTAVSGGTVTIGDIDSELELEGDGIKLDGSSGGTSTGGKLDVKSDGDIDVQAGQSTSVINFKDNSGAVKANFIASSETLTIGTNTIRLSGSGDISASGDLQMRHSTASAQLITSKGPDVEDLLTVLSPPSANFDDTGSAAVNVDLSGSVSASNAYALKLTSPDNNTFGIKSDGSILSGDVSGSATSTASFGTYEGDGQYLTNTDPFPYTGSAIISGSTELVGPVNITGSTIIFSSGTPGLTIQSNSDVTEETKIYDAKIALEDSGLEQVVIKSNSATSTMFGNISLRAATLAYGFLAAHNYHSANRISWLSSGIRLGERLSDPDSSPNQTSPFVLSATGSVGFEGNTQITGSLEITGNVSGSATSTASFGTYEGDGQYLTNTDPFPYTGDATITGSLIISGSFNAFRLNTTDVILGEGAGALSTINGPRNVFVGYQSGYSNTNGDDNVAIGYQAGYGLHNNASDSNVFVGKLAGGGGTSGAARMSDANSNVGVGSQALLYLSTGDSNIAIGAAAMRGSGAAMSATQNIALGVSALFKTDSGDNNIGIGYNAGLDQTTGDGNITIGSGSLGIAGESNQLRIGNGNSLVTISASLATGDLIFASTASSPIFSGKFEGDTSGSSVSTGNVITTTLTASGEISASDIYATNLYGADAVYHKDDANTGIVFSSDTIKLRTNNIESIHLSTTSNLFGNDQDPTIISGSSLTVDTSNTTITGSLNVTGSIEMALPSGSGASYQSFGVPGYFKTRFGQNDSDFEIYRDNFITLQFNNAGSDQIEGSILTDPSAGEIHVTVNNEGTYTYLDKQVSDGIFDIDGSFGNDEISVIYMRSPQDDSWPFYKITVISANATSGASITLLLEKFI